MDNLARQATLIKGPSGGAVVVSGESQQASADTSGVASPSVQPGPVINYELWVSSSVDGHAAPRSSRTPVDLYKRTYQGAAQARPKIVDVFA